MEVLVGRVNHPLLWEWLHFMAREMERLPYSRGFWRKARMRYIWNTTGPLAMQRFLRLPANRTWSADISYTQCSTSEEGDDNSARDLQRYDVVSCTSNTYYTKAHRVVVGVTDLAAPLPPRVAPLRCKRKSPPSPRRAPSQLVRSSTPHRRTANAAARQEADANAAIEARAAARAGAGTATPGPAASEHAVLQIAAASAEANAAIRTRDEAIAAAADARREKDAAVEEAIAARRERDAAIAQATAASSRADTWAAAAVSLRNTAAGHTFLQMCPEELIREVRDPTETVRRQALAFYDRPPVSARP